MGTHEYQVVAGLIPRGDVRLVASRVLIFDPFTGERSQVASAADGRVRDFLEAVVIGLGIIIVIDAYSIAASIISAVCIVDTFDALVVDTELVIGTIVARGAFIGWFR